MLLFERRMFSLVFLSFCSMLSKTQYDFTLCNLSFKNKHWLKTQNYFNLKAQWNKLALWEYFIIPFHLYIYIYIYMYCHIKISILVNSSKKPQTCHSDYVTIMMCSSLRIWYKIRVNGTLVFLRILTDSN